MNRYRRVNAANAMISGRSPIPVEGLFIGGIVLDRSPQDLEPNQSPDLNAVRYVRGAMQQDFDFDVMGQDAANQILAIGEHRFVTYEQEIMHQVFRLLLSGNGEPVFEVWDTAQGDWVLGVEGTDISILPVIASWKSFFESVYFADGEKIIRWIQSPEVVDRENDFPSDIILREEDDSTTTEITPANAILNEYFVHFGVKIVGPSAQPGSVVVALVMGEEEIASTSIFIPASTDGSRVFTRPHETLHIFEEIEDQDILEMKIKSIHRTPVEVTESLLGDLDVGESPTVRTPNLDLGPVTSGFLFHFGLEVGEPGSVILGFYYHDGENWIKDSEQEFSEGENLSYTIFPPAENVTRLAINKEAQSPPDSPHPWVIQDPKVSWSEVFSVEVKPFNKEVDDDPEAGVTYRTAEGPQNAVEVVEYSSSPLGARYLGIFAQRLIALQALGEPAQIGWSASGQPNDWEGLGSGFAVLDSRSDPVDALMAIEPLSSNIAALFRERSIMRVTQTGQVEPALAFFPWIEQLGTESPHSIARIPGGLIFLGHNRSVYQLTESGPEEIGRAIQEELESLITNPSTVVGVYDPIDQQYLLSVGDVLWVFDFRTGAWLRRYENLELLTIVEGSDVLATTNETTVVELNRDSVVSGAYWTSPTLNQQNAQAEYSLVRLILRYEAEDDTKLVVQASGDGGETWVTGFKQEIEVNKTSGDVRRTVQGFNITGYDLRFRILFPSDAKVKLRRWRAELLQRGHFGRE